VLIVVAHAISAWIARARVAPAGRRRIIGIPAGWWAAVVGAGIVLIPLLLAAERQQGQIGWLSAPTSKALMKLVTDFPGSPALRVPVYVLALGGAVAGFAARRGRPYTPGTVALPWLLVPPVILLAVSYAHPVYDERYVEFCVPALAILVAAGLVWLGHLLAATPVSRLGIAWLPSALIAVALAALLIAPQRAFRLSSAKPDNLHKAAALVAANELPGDVVFYMPSDAHILGQGYPAPFRKLRDLAQASSPRASDSLNGTQVSPPVLAKRFTGVRRVWFVTGQSNHKFPVASSAIDREKMALVSGMHIVHRWMANEVMLTLYAR
jgi:mannosyltransferase